MNWREAFLKQAQSDYAVMLLLRNASSAVPECHWLHYLQMATEKLAKHFRSKPSRPPERSHRGIVHLLHYARQHSWYRELLAFHGFDAYARKTSPLHTVAEKLENLAPDLAGDGNPNAEYPWRESRMAEVVAPSQHTFFTPEEQPALRKLVDLIGQMLAAAERAASGT